MIQALEQSLRERWDLVAPRAAPRTLHFLKFGWEESPHLASPLVFLVFADRDTRPVAVAKAARAPAADAAVDRESEHLLLAHRTLPRELAAIVPRPLAHGQVNGRSFLLATGLAGELELHHTWGARRAGRSGPRIAAALRWARDAAAAAPAAEIGLCEWLGAPDPESILARFEPRWSAADLLRLEPRLRAACGARWPAGWAHGDFFPGNLLFTGDALTGVVDWAHAFQRAPCFTDPMLYELTFVLDALQHGSRHAGQESAAVQALPPFAAARHDLEARGIDIGPARLAVLVAGATRDTGAWAMRAGFAARCEALLRLEQQTG